MVALFVIFSDYQTLLSFVATDKEAIPTKVVLGRDAMKIAFCVTGQLQRLEILSKIANIFIPNAKMGHVVHVFVLLDDTPEVKQTFWRYDYSDTPYANYTTARLERLIARKTYAANLGGYFKAHVRVGPPSQDLFEVVDGFVPVWYTHTLTYPTPPWPYAISISLIHHYLMQSLSTFLPFLHLTILTVQSWLWLWYQVRDKIINTDAQKTSTKDGQGVNSDMLESAEARFKNNLAWMAGCWDTPFEDNLLN